MRLFEQGIKSACPFGGAKPFILRPAGDYYTLVRECIRMSRMSGQAINSWRAGELIVRFFKER